MLDMHLWHFLFQSVTTKPKIIAYGIYPKVPSLAFLPDVEYTANVTFQKLSRSRLSLFHSGFIVQSFSPVFWSMFSGAHRRFYSQRCLVSFCTRLQKWYMSIVFKWQTNANWHARERQKRGSTEKCLVHFFLAMESRSNYDSSGRHSAVTLLSYEEGHWRYGSTALLFGQSQNRYLLYQWCKQAVMNMFEDCYFLIYKHWPLKAECPFQGT